MRIDSSYKIMPESHTPSVVFNYPSGVKFFSGFLGIGNFRGPRIQERFWASGFVGAYDKIVIVSDSHVHSEIVH